MQTQILGKTGEDLCVQKLKEESYIILNQNYSSAYGEIDIIAKDGHELVFIEVKTRSNQSIDHTKNSITKSKQKKITKTAMFFLLTFDDPEISEYRFDVIIVSKSKSHIDINHYKNAFTPVEADEFFI